MMNNSNIILQHFYQILQQFFLKKYLFISFSVLKSLFNLHVEGLQNAGSKIKAAVLLLNGLGQLFLFTSKVMFFGYLPQKNIFNKHGISTNSKLLL